MHGTGNDFVVIDIRKQIFHPDKQLIKFLANRHTGIGFDQMILIQNSTHPECDAAYQFFNPDGTEAEQCGNGQRCIAHFLHIEQPENNHFSVSGKAGLIGSQINPDSSITINMGSIKSINTINTNNKLSYEVNFGNPHLVHQLDSVDGANLTQLNKVFSKNYSQGINFEITEVIDKKNIKLRVHERGTGETMACGSGACATVAALQNANLVSDKVNVLLPGGVLVVEYNSQDNNLYLTGPSAYVYSGEFSI